MTNPNHTDTSRSDLVERLRTEVETAPDSVGISTSWLRNPDGPEAADRIEALEAENERLCVVIGDNARFVCKILDEQDVEIERLRAEVARLGAVLRNLEMSEAQYREVHDLDGYGSSQARRAWDLMRRAGDAARAALGEK